METLQVIMDEFKIKGHFSIGQIQNFTEKCLQSHNKQEDYDNDSCSAQLSRKDAYELLNQVISHPSDGTPNDYHNYAVTFAEIDNYTIACEVLLRGLEKYNTHIDLLSDFLIYGIRSSKDEHYEMCEAKYEILKTRRPLWSWRAYDFSIEYLLNKIDRGKGAIEELKEECLKLALEFQDKLPSNELGYVAEARIYSMFCDRENETRALKKAFDREDILIGRVGMSLAKIYLQLNKPEMAMKCMERVIKNISSVGLNISPAFAWSLLIISKTAKLMGSWKATMELDAGQNADLALVKEIVGDWDKAKRISDTSARYYEDTKGLVDFVKAISNYNSVDDEEL